MEIKRRMHKTFNEEAAYLVNMGKRIQQMRIAKGVTQTELAKLCYCGKSSLSRLEAGQVNPKMLTLKRLADVMQVTVPQLLVS